MGMLFLYLFQIFKFTHEKYDNIHTAIIMNTTSVNMGLVCIAIIYIIIIAGYFFLVIQIKNSAVVVA